MTARRSASPKAKTNLLTSLVLVLPLLVFYELGVLFSSIGNGADLITQTLIRLLGVQGFVWVQIGLLALVVVIAIALRRQQQFQLGQIIPVLLESGIYALTMGTLIIFVMVDVIGIDPRLAAGTGSLAQASAFERLVMSIGAGVHEEILFRLVIMGGLIALFTRAFNIQRVVAVLLALLISAGLFSAAHHIGPLGEPLRVGVFVYRAIAGMVFGLLFYFRSFAIAVYTHALYDIYVLLMQ